MRSSPKIVIEYWSLLLLIFGTFNIVSEKKLLYTWIGRMNIYFFIIKLFSPFFLNIHLSWFSDFLHVISQQMCCLYFKKRYTCIYPHQHFTGHQRVSPALGFTQLSLPESQWMKVWRVRQSKRVREGGKGYDWGRGYLQVDWGGGGAVVAAFPNEK